MITFADIDAIRVRHEQFATVDYDIESHEHGEKGCRCLTCNVTTGWAVHAGRNCDEHPDAVNAAGGGCIRGVLEYDQAEYLVQAVKDVGVLLNALDAQLRDTRPWPAAQQMPYATAGARVQPWHIQAVVAYDHAHDTTTEPNSNLPGMYAAAQINQAITWWNKRALTQGARP